MAWTESAARQVLTGWLNRSRNVSSRSATVSAVTGTSTVTAVCPGAMVATPRPDVKSTPAVAVSPSVAQFTDTGSVDGRASVNVNRAALPSRTRTGATWSATSESAKARTRPSPSRL